MASISSCQARIIGMVQIAMFTGDFREGRQLAAITVKQCLNSRVSFLTATLAFKLVRYVDYPSIRVALPFIEIVVKLRCRLLVTHSRSDALGKCQDFIPISAELTIP